MGSTHHKRQGEGYMNISLDSVALF